ncbi:hypothetical protein ACH5RR_039691 [Cinchona calisaya]|uniref:RNase H type-1 domain-containing protein n=1 Tax=Cinchona calisaya TaxID=153742 RepID=A0ABD2Y4K6_9GENT
MFGIWGVASNILFELWGIRDGLELGISFNVICLEVEVNCQDLVTRLTENTCLLHNLSTLILDCRNLLSSFEKCKISHIYREGSRCAYGLAKLGSSSTVGRLAKLGSSSTCVFAILDHCPSSLNSILFEDARGVYFPP